MKKIIVFLTVFMLVGCDQFITKEFGGECTIELSPGQRLVEATWKDANLWYLTETMDSDYVPKVKIFKESSLLGVAEGKVVFIEKK